MLDPKDCGVTMTSSHKISFSIIDILDPNKFNSKRVNELSTVNEKFLVPNEEGTSLVSDNTAGGDFRVESGKAGREKNFRILFSLKLKRVLFCIFKSHLLQNIQTYQQMRIHTLSCLNTAK